MKTNIRGQRSEVRSQSSEYALRSPLSALRAFTLVELLVVISIIAILLGIIVPSYFSIREKAKYTKAKVTAKNLETAFKAYLDHYRAWPPAAFGEGEKQIDVEVVNILKGVQGDDNKDGIAFYEFETTNSMDGALDPWTNPNDPDPAAVKTYYWVQVDADYDNKITTGSGQELYRTVLVWSWGADRTNGTSDDVRSWD